jgi:hypothetical protein
MKDFRQDFERRLDMERLGPALSRSKEQRQHAPLLGRRHGGGLDGVGGTGRGGAEAAAQRAQTGVASDRRRRGRLWTEAQSAGAFIPVRARWTASPCSAN